MANNKILAGIILAGILVVAIAFIAINQLPTKTTETTTTTLLSKPQMVVEKGDIVEVNYIGSFINGTVFDTSYRDVAVENNIYDPARRYPPLKFKVGAGQVIPGFDDAVIGMMIGEEKTVKIPSTLAYGRYDPNLVIEVNRTQTSSRVQNVTLKRFMDVVGEEPFIGMNFTVSGTPWPITVVDILDSTNLTDKIIYIKHNPLGGEVVDTMLGNATVEVTDSEILITANPILGMNYNGARITAINESTITVDMNHELAGQTLLFKIKLENVTKAQVAVLNLTRQ